MCPRPHQDNLDTRPVFESGTSQKFLSGPLPVCHLPGFREQLSLGTTLPISSPQVVVPSMLEQTLALVCMSQPPPPPPHLPSPSNLQVWKIPLSAWLLPHWLRSPSSLLECSCSSGRKQGSLMAGDWLQGRKPGFYFCL